MTGILLSSLLVLVQDENMEMNPIEIKNKMNLHVWFFKG